MKNRSCAAAFVLYGAVCLVSSSLFAADVSLQESGYYFNAAGGWDAGSDHKPTAGNDYWVANGLTLRTPNEGSNKGLTYTFAGDSLNLGAADGSTSGLLMIKTIGNSKSVVNGLKVSNGKIYVGSEGTGWLTGACAIQPNGTLTLDGTGTGSGAGKYRNVTFDLSVSGDASTTLSVCGTQHDVDADGLPLARNSFYLKGDHSAYSGILSVADYGLLSLTAASAFGNTASPRTNAVLVRANGILRIGVNVVQSAARGLSVEKGTGYLRVAASQPISLVAPVSGEGTLVKIEPGTVTLESAYTAAGLSVRQGSVLVGSSGSVDAACKVEVASGCEFGGNLASVTGSLAFAEGSTLRVAFDSASGVSTPYAPSVSAAAAFVEGTVWPLKVELEGSIALPTAAGTIPLLKLLKTAKVLQPTDFTCSLTEIGATPRCTIVVADDPDDASLQVVSLSHDQVVSFVSPTDVRGLNAQKSQDGNSFVWSNELAPQSTLDYYCDNSSGSGHGGYTSATGYETGTATFGGKSLTLAANAKLQSKHQKLFFSNLILEPGSSLWGIGWTGTTYANHVISGKISVCGTEASPAEVYCSSTYGFSIDAQLCGSGVLKLSRAKIGVSRLSGDNSSFAGSLVFTCNTTAQTTGHVIRVASAATLGGALTDFNPRALVLQNATLCQPDVSMTLEAANRGIYVTQGGFRVPSGLALDIKESIRLNGSLVKAGEGTLTLGGGLSFGEDGTSAGTGTDNVLNVLEGSVAALSDASVAGLAANFGENAGICLRRTASLTNGFTGTITATGAIPVWLEAESSNAAASITLPICTVVEGTSLSFDIKRARGYSAELQTEAVSLNDQSCVRYSVRYCRCGLVLVVR